MPLGIRLAVALTLIVAAGLSLTPHGSAALECRDQVLADWSDNGRIDRLYPLDCYQQAMRSLPPEIRDYSDAPEIIDRALTLAVRKQGGERRSALPPTRAVAASAREEYARTAIPTALLVLGATGLGALALGGIAYAGHRAASGRRPAAR